MASPPPFPPKSKEQRKKLQKRCYKGLVATHSVAVECVRLGVFVRPSLRVQHDSSRSASRHQVTIGELRALLLALFTDGAAVPKYFSVANKALIRNVFNVHVTDAADPNALLREILGDTTKEQQQHEVYTARVCRGSENMDGESASSRLLSLSKDNSAIARAAAAASTSADGGGAMDAYVVSEEAMRTWGFPLPDPYPQPGHPPSVGGRKRKLLSQAEGVTDCADQRPSRVEGVRFCLYQDAVPSLAQAEALLATTPLHSITASYCPRGAAAAVRGEGFFETLSLQSAGHKNLRGAVAASTSSSSSGHGSPIVVALDCEMCETANGCALARLTLVDEHSRVLLDTYVLPAEPIVNYNTQYSGIDAAALAGVTVSLLQAQLAFLLIVPAETILVGHSVENDLRALKIVHRRVVDTSLLYPHSRGFPYRRGLRSLAEEYLKIGIQQGGAAGHDSVEDARAALLLALEKVRRGPLYGLPSTSSKNPYSREPLLDSVDRASLGVARFMACHQPELQLYSALAGRGGAAVSTDWMAGRQGLLSFAREEVVRVDPSSASLFEDCKKVSMCYLCCSASETSAAELSQLLEELRHTLREGDGSSSGGYPSSSLLLLTAQAPLATAAELSRQRLACADPRASALWSDALEERLHEAARRANYAALHMEVL